MARYVIDASSIIEVVMRLREDAISFLEECVSADLVLYEIGNFLWKTRYSELLEPFRHVLEFIPLESVGLNHEVLKIANDERLTYYDAVYLYLSRRRGLQLISEDNDLVRRGAITVQQALGK
ncbi:MULTISPECIES: type II toxin-antitoxin system VapC family toxin [Metallosphaera]|uniref:PilT protein domain protein n=3 Tax=Metallosphaera TaxID=41980 RepID=A4YF69_METS5|nr:MULTISPECIES: type II toxin-antitoxin system VapC family toxin [Metallosphaera]ABP95071.1 PilT protein domain protein [Metallosphaera sedula DSM 5348]AIM27057.1 PilT protein domain protein [Metallosphaera sedula]AKV73973.1 twitching motility protein PilT [Metallosphaera sedula]AKV76212.1 twitching motility protein PilT [Metallosphaera sedula]AKV78465.1 twitching motility protein PilT [Metallosphaera sedula]